MKVLGIETSCDETAVCLIEASGNFPDTFEFKVLGNALLSQAAMHAQYGGVFPNMAKREHAKNLVPLLEQALKDAGILKESGKEDEFTELKGILAREPELFDRLTKFFKTYGKPEIDCIAVTVGPGLEPALWVGINFARALSMVWSLPVVAVNHMEGHIVMSMMKHSHIPKYMRVSQGLERFEFPLLSLLISGGHTELVLSREWTQYEIVGKTRDDAVGEAFDKVARLLDLPYPGGPEISRLAHEAREEKLMLHSKFPRPMRSDGSFDFSFSGLKTAVRRLVESHAPISEITKKQIAREFEDTVTDVLVEKTLNAIDEYGAKTVIVGGGVSANTHIKKVLGEKLKSIGVKLLIPPAELATDNALMISLAGYFHAQREEFAQLETLKADGNLKLQ